MTLLHQAAQKAVEALEKVDGTLESRGEYVQEISFALVTLQAALRKSALQQQEVPREPAIDADTLFGLRRYLNDVLAEGTVNERVVAQTALRMIATPPAAAPSTPESAEKDDAGGGKGDQRG